MNSDIASKLLALRKQNGFSQEELAEKLGVSRQAVSKWERGEASPDTENLILLAGIYSISLDRLFGIETDSVSRRSVINLEKNSDENSGEYPGRVMYPEGSSGEEIYPSSAPSYDEQTAEIPYKEPEENLGKYFNYETVDDTCESTASEETKSSTVYEDIADRIVTDDDFYEKLKKVPYPVAVTALYLIAGALFNLWHPMWMIFLTIPLYYTAVEAVRKRKPSLFCFPVAVTMMYLFAGFYLGLWHPGWLMFLSIPFYYLIFSDKKDKKQPEN